MIWRKKEEKWQTTEIIIFTFPQSCLANSIKSKAGSFEGKSRIIFEFRQATEPPAQNILNVFIKQTLRLTLKSALISERYFCWFLKQENAELRGLGQGLWAY